MDYLSGDLELSLQPREDQVSSSAHGLTVLQMTLTPSFILWDRVLETRTSSPDQLGAAFLSADLELALQPREDHASYIAHWLMVLQNDKRAIFRAAAHAQRAADHLHALQFSSQEAA